MMLTRITTRRAPLAAACAVAPSFANPNIAAAGDDWQYAGTIYLWGAGIKGETAGGADVDVSFDTLINNLNMAFMGAFEARKGEWSAVADRRGALAIAAAYEY